jgi:predicted O-methyltransferase YrrM
MLYFDKYNEFLAQKGLSLDRSKQDNILFRSVNPLTLEFFISETDPSQIKTILEIGRSNGYSFGFFRFAFPQAKVISVDIVRTKTSEKVAQLFDNNFLFVDGTSEELKKINSIYDLVFIDGEHTFEWAKRDWGNVQPFLSSNAVVFFDDLDWGIVE